MHMKTTKTSCRPSFDQAVIELPAQQTQALFRISASEFKDNFKLSTNKEDVLKFQTDVSDKNTTISINLLRSSCLFPLTLPK